MTEHLYAHDQASQTLGIHLIEAGAGAARLSMRVRPDMLNGHGICHGGVVFALADTAFAYACNSRGPSVAAHCSISFLAPAQLDDELIASAREAALEGGTGIYDVVVTNAAGETLALFRGASRRLKQGASPVAPRAQGG